MSNIKQTALFTRPLMAVTHAEIGILHWHGEAAKWDHLATFLNMEIV